MTEEDFLNESSVENLRKKLYDKNKRPKLRPRRTLHEKEYQTNDSWGDEKDIKKTSTPVDAEKELEELYRGHIDGEDNSILDTETSEFVEKPRVISRFIKVIFWASFLFFAFAVGVASYFLLGGKNQISCKNVDIVISGPKTIASGKKLTFDVFVVNNNPVSMKNTSMEVSFPKGTRDPIVTSKSMLSVNEQIGVVDVGERVRSTVSAVLFGQENTNYDIKTNVSYNVLDSDASFSCEKVYKVQMATAPVNLVVDGLEEISSGQEVELEVTITSNSEEVVPDLRLVVDYPFGFEFVSSSPEPSTEDNVWDLGDITPGMVRTLKLKGIVKGQGVESREVSFNVGTKDNVDNKVLATVLQKTNHPLLITKPFIEMESTINKSNTPEVVVNTGDVLEGALNWKNNSQNSLYDVEIECVFDGAMLNVGTVFADRGFFRSIDNTIIWTPQTDKTFKMVEPGQSGSLGFRFSTNNIQNDTSIENPTISIKFNARARRVSNNIPVPQNLQNQAKKTILFNSNVSLDAYALYGVGSFTNTGPNPPKVNKETTYTIVWNVKNTTNDLGTAIIKGELPVNVKWVGNISPNEESVEFNPVTREVSWDIGDLPRGTGYSTNAKEVSFQVSTIPSISQIHNVIILMNESTFQAVDSFTNNVIKRTAPEVDTKLNRDPFFKDTDGYVMK